MRVLSSTDPVALTGSSRFNPDRATSPVVYVEHFRDTPSVDHLLVRMHELGMLDTSATYLLFVDTAEDLNWLRTVKTPDNVKLSVSVRSMAASDLQGFFDTIDVDYDSSQARIDYRLAVKMAIAQLDKGTLYENDFITREWTSGKSYAGIFDEIVEPNAQGTQASTMLSVQKFIQDRRREFPGIENVNGIILQNLDEGHVGVRSALAWDVLRKECKTSYPWTKVTENGLDFQSFGIVSR